MKKLLLPALLAALFGSAHAGTDNLSEYRKSFSLEEVAAAPDLTDGVCDDWKVVGNTLVDASKLPRHFSRSAFEAGRALTRVYVDAGYMTVRVAPNQESCTLQVREMQANPSGFYENFVPRKSLKTLDMEHFGTLISRHASDSQKRVRITFGEPDVATGLVPVVTETTDIADPTQTASTIVYNSLGPRYSGSDVATGYVKHSANGVRYEGSATVGLAGIRDESKGGAYAAASGKISGATPYGIFGVESNVSSYTVGGPYKNLSIKGTTWRTQLVGEYPLTTRTSVEGRLAYVSQHQEMAVHGLNDDQSYETAYIGARTSGELYGASTFAVSGGVLANLAGKQSYTLVPLSGAFDKHFTLVRGDASVSIPTGNDGQSVQVVASAQLSSKGVPGGEQFYLGGLDRGSSYATGVYAGHSGMSAGAKYNSKPLDTKVSGYDLKLQPFIGVNGGTLKQATGDTASVLSLEGGTGFVLSKQISGTVSYAQRIDGNKRFPGSSGRLNVAINLVF